MTRAYGRCTAAAIALVVAACSQGGSDAGEISHAPDGASAATSGLCKLLSRDEIAAAVGSPVADGNVAGPLGSGCQWELANERSVMIQVVPRDYWEDGTNAPGGEALADIGEKAFVGPWLDDQRAGALTPNGAVYVISPSRDASVTLLRQVATRVPPQ